MAAISWLLKPLQSQVTGWIVFRSWVSEDQANHARSLSVSCILRLRSTCTVCIYLDRCE